MTEPSFMLSFWCVFAAFGFLYCLVGAAEGGKVRPTLVYAPLASLGAGLCGLGAEYQSAICFSLFVLSALASLFGRGKNGNGD